MTVAEVVVDDACFYRCCSWMVVPFMVMVRRMSRLDHGKVCSMCNDYVRFEPFNPCCWRCRVMFAKLPLIGVCVCVLFGLASLSSCFSL